MCLVPVFKMHVISWPRDRQRFNLFGNVYVHGIIHEEIAVEICVEDLTGLILMRERAIASSSYKDCLAKFALSKPLKRVQLLTLHCLAITDFESSGNLRPLHKVLEYLR